VDQPRPNEGTRVVALAGSGLAKAVGLPAHHDAEGQFKGTPASELRSPGAWAADPDRVKAYYDERRMAVASVLPSEAHEALARMQHALTKTRCTLVTENIDGMLLKASAEEVLEIHGSLFRLRCAADASHPQLGVFGPQGQAPCKVCGAPLRPAVVWAGEAPLWMDTVTEAVSHCDVFLAVGTSAQSRAVATLIDTARAHGARTIAINPAPAGGPFDEVFREEAQVAVPKLVSRWLDA